MVLKIIGLTGSTVDIIVHGRITCAWDYGDLLRTLGGALNILEILEEFTRISAVADSLSRELFDAVSFANR